MNHQVTNDQKPGRGWPQRRLCADRLFGSHFLGPRDGNAVHRRWGNVNVSGNVNWISWTTPILGCCGHALAESHFLICDCALDCWIPQFLARITSGSQVTSSDPGAGFVNMARKKNTAIWRHVAKSEILQVCWEMMVKQEMVGDSNSRQAVILDDKVVWFSYSFPMVFTIVLWFSSGFHNCPMVFLWFSPFSYGFPMCIFIYTFISCLTTLHPY